jgi:hypothetical protein
MNLVMNLKCYLVGPLSVKLVDMVETLSAGKRCEAKCEIVGARPPPR